MKKLFRFSENENRKFPQCEAIQLMGKKRVIVENKNFEGWKTFDTSDDMIDFPRYSAIFSLAERKLIYQNQKEIFSYLHNTKKICIDNQSKRVNLLWLPFFWSVIPLYRQPTFRSFDVTRLNESECLSNEDSRIDRQNGLV